MIDLSSYSAALQSKQRIEARHKIASDALRAISGGGAMGLTPDCVKQSPEYQAKLHCFNQWHATLTRFNRAFLRRYGAEYRADMRARRSGIIEAH